MKGVKAIKCIYNPLWKGVFCVKWFWPITGVENNSQEKFTILHFSHIGFLCYSNWGKILLYRRWLESKDEYRVFSLTWPAYMQIYWNKRKRLHKKRVQLPEDWFGTPTWPPFHCFGTPIWPPWRHVKTLYMYCFMKFC